MIFYQGRALKLLGRHEVAAARFQSLIDYGDAHLEVEPEIDFFAVSLPDFLVFEENLKRRNAMHCRYMIALGLIGKNRADEAVSQFDQILAIDPSHLGAVIHHPSAHHPSAGADNHEREQPCRFER